MLTCGSGFDQPDLAICRQINDRMREAEKAHPGRFIGLAHVPALKPAEAAAELKRCAVELGFPGVVIGSELQDQPLDAEALRPFWKACADLNLYVFIHPLPRVIAWARMDADDLGRMLGWEFSLMTAAVRLINSGLLDELPTLRIQFRISPGHRPLSRPHPWLSAAQQAGHRGRAPPRPAAAPAVRRLSRSPALLRYRRLGRPRSCRGMGADWVRFGLDELSFSQLVFASDYPQAVREPGEVAGYVEAVRALGGNGRALTAGVNAEKLIPDIAQRLVARQTASAKVPA